MSYVPYRVTGVTANHAMDRENSRRFPEPRAKFPADAFGHLEPCHTLVGRDYA